MGYSDLTTRSAGYKVTATDWNALVNGMNLANSGTAGKGRPAVMATDTSTTAITTGTWTLMTFASEEYDTSSMHSTSSNTGRLTVGTGDGGLYHVTATVALDYNATAKSCGLMLRKNAAGSATGGTLITQSSTLLSTNSFFISSTSLSTHVRLSAADYVEVFVWHDKGTNLSLKGGDMTHRFGMYLVTA